MKTKHIKLRASQSEIWANCPGSVHYKAFDNPKKLNGPAMFGTACHNVAGYCIKKGIPEVTPETLAPIFAELEADNLEMILAFEEMDRLIEYVNYYLTAINNIIDGFDDPNPAIYVETYFEHKTKDFTIGGTSDFIALYSNPAGQLCLFVADLKTGFDPVEVIENQQLFNYANLFAFENFDGTEIAGANIEKVTTAIIQPSLNQVTYNYNIPINKKLFEGQFKDTKKLKCGLWCKYCPAAFTCKEIKKEMNAYLEPHFLNKAFSTPEAVAELYPMASVISKIADRVKDEAKTLLREGIEVPGYELATKNHHRQWLQSISFKDISKKTKLKKADLIDEKLKSPPQVEKLIGKKNKDLLSGLIFQPQIEYIKEKQDIFGGF